MRPPESISLTPGKRILFLTKDPDLIRRQLAGELDLRMEDLSVDDLLDDINTDAMTPAWVCFDHDPAEIAKNAYAGLIVDGERLVPERALLDGGFEVIVSGLRKGVGSSRETAAQCEKWCGIKLVIAASFAPIHARNNINLGTLMGDHAMLTRLQAGESIPLPEFYESYDPVTQLVVQHGGLFPFAKALAAGELTLPASENEPRPLTMAEKILASRLVGEGSRYPKPGDPVVVNVDAGYSHEFTTAQVHNFLAAEYGDDYAIANPSKFAVFEDHLIYADGVAQVCGPSSTRSRTLRQTCRTGVPGAHRGACQLQCRRRQDFSGNLPPGGARAVHRTGRLHSSDRQPHLHGWRQQRRSCLGRRRHRVRGNLDLLGGFTIARTCPSRFDSSSRWTSFAAGVTAKDVILHILNDLRQVREETLESRDGVRWRGTLQRSSPDERATLGQHGDRVHSAHRASWSSADDSHVSSGWPSAAAARVKAADEHAREDRQTRRRMPTTMEACTPSTFPSSSSHGRARRATLRKAASRPIPKNGAQHRRRLARCDIDIAYGGSCTAGKCDRHRLLRSGLGRKQPKAGKPNCRRHVGVPDLQYRQQGSGEQYAQASKRLLCSVFERDGSAPHQPPAVVPASAVVQASRTPPRTRSRSLRSIATTRAAPAPAVSTWPAH